MRVTTQWVTAIGALVLCCGSAWAGTYSGGSGTRLDPYQIATAADLIALSRAAADWDAHFIQTADIVFAADETQVDWDGDTVLEWGAGDHDTFGFSPLGSPVWDGQDFVGTPFSGSYDGDGYTIGNLYIDRPATFFIGLFGTIDGATIRNLRLVDTDITGNAYTGGLVGYAASDSAICNSTATGMVAGTVYVGGLAGRSCDVSSIINSAAAVTVAGEQCVGGLVGYAFDDASITNSSAIGAVTGDVFVGGLAGAMGGIITNSYATGTVSGGQYVGGLVGSMGGTITNSYATGAVSGDQHTGGLVAGMGDAPTITASYYDTDTTGQSDTGKGLPLTTAQFADSGNFAGSWHIDYAGGPDDNHPWLQGDAPRPYLYEPDDTPPACPAATVLGPTDPRLATLRIFRDRVLTTSAAGRQCIDWYYRCDFDELLADDPVMRKVCRNILIGLMPVVKRVVGQ